MVISTRACGSQSRAGAQVVADHALDGVGVHHQIVECAVFGDPFTAVFGPHWRRGHVVDRIADQRERNR